MECSGHDEDRRNNSVTDWVVERVREGCREKGGNAVARALGNQMGRVELPSHVHSIAFSTCIALDLHIQIATNMAHTGMGVDEAVWACSIPITGGPIDLCWAIFSCPDELEVCSEAALCSCKACGDFWGVFMAGQRDLSSLSLARLSSRILSALSLARSFAWRSLITRVCVQAWTCIREGVSIFSSQHTK